MQRLRSPQNPPASIITNRQVATATQTKSSSILLRLSEVQEISGESEELEVDYLFTATGYKRNAHEEILSEIKELLPAQSEKFGVKRDYSVIFEQGKVDENAGVWLQGCNEGTHGVSFPFLLLSSLTLSFLLASFSDKAN